MQVNTRLVVFVLSAFSEAAGVMVGGASLSAMIQEVNRNKEAGERFPTAWLGPSRHLQLLKEYGRLCPRGRQLRRYVVGCVLLAAGFVGVTVSLGIIG